MGINTKILNPQLNRKIIQERSCDFDLAPGLGNVKIKTIISFNKVMKTINLINCYIFSFLDP